MTRPTLGLAVSKPAEDEHPRMIEQPERLLRGIIVDAQPEQARVDLEGLDQRESQLAGEQILVVLPDDGVLAAPGRCWYHCM